MTRRRPFTKTRKQQARARPARETEPPLTAAENHPAVLHCDICELGLDLHRHWRSVDGVPITVRCTRHDVGLR